MNVVQIQSQIASLEAQIKAQLSLLTSLKAQLTVTPQTVTTMEQVVAAKVVAPIATAPRRIINVGVVQTVAIKKWVRTVNTSGKVCIRLNPEHPSFRSQFEGTVVYSDPVAVKVEAPKPSGRGEKVGVEKNDLDARTRTQRKKARKAGEVLPKSPQQLEQEELAAKFIAAKQKAAAERKAKKVAAQMNKQANNSKKAAKQEKVAAKTNNKRGNK